ncbi:pyridoxal 5'-phosphate synthase glutaminase subunit PdxT [Ethanoligenens sp.]|uniref:pyridoxal 5'-phosphate synthase glutaminase subunit PdxT n=1 Tax=Ethanoligenens sp. TaxID=2099655 RepID=UPI0039ED6E60
MKTVGVLALQGSFREHLRQLAKLDGILPCPVKTTRDLAQVDGIILPGGESTAQGKLLRDFGLLEPLRTRIQQGLPIWGTCAGLILLAKRITDHEPAHLGVMDITVRRNAYGGQLDSFSTSTVLPAVSPEPLPLVFIRAPWIESIGENVEPLAVQDGRIIAAKERHMIATSFHPELTDDPRFHAYFVGQIA